MTKEVEDIIKNKAFAELTLDERKRVGDLAANEAEYANMQWFLLAAASSFESSKISASPKTKKRVMEHLTAAGEKKGFWLNSVGVFMLPKGEPVYKKPLIQLGIAAALVVGFLVYFNSTIPDNNLALNTPVLNEFDEQRADKIIEPNTNDSFTRMENTEGEYKEEVINEEIPSPVLLNDQRDMDMVKDAPAPSLNWELKEEAIAADEEIESVFEGVAASELVEEKNERATEKALKVVPVADNELRADRNKKRAESLADIEEEPQKADDSVTETLVNGNAFTTISSGTIANNQEEIIPKSLHIDKTKELNQLFFVVK